MHPGLQLQDQSSFSTESTGLSHLELIAMGKTTSQDQSAPSDSVFDNVKHGENMKLTMSINASESQVNQPMLQFPYAFSDPYGSGLYTAYGPHPMIQPQLLAAASGRLMLPSDLSEDGPLYVNAKQYHAILRRREARAKLEAQNKLIKTRKPYLHESRHRHALNRNRGSGGRFLSRKKPPHSDSRAPTVSQTTSDGSFRFNEQENMSNANEDRFEGGSRHDPPSTTEGTKVSGADVISQQPDSGFSSAPSHVPASMQSGGSLAHNGNRHYASIIR